MLAWSPGPNEIITGVAVEVWPDGERKKGLVNGLRLIQICGGILPQLINNRKLHSLG